MKLKNNIKILTWFNFFTDFRLYAPIAIIYFSQRTDSFALGMSIFGVASLSAALFELPTGVLSDYIGRKRTIILGSVAAAFSVLCYALGFSYWVLIIGAVFEGLARSFYSGNNEALLHETLSETGEEEAYHHYHGKLSGMFQIALGISALVGGLLAVYSLSLVFWLSIIPQIFCIILSFIVIEPTRMVRESGNIYAHLSQSIKLFIKNPKLRLLSLSSIWGYGFGESQYQFRAAFVATVWPIWALGFAQMLTNIGATIGFFFAGRFIQKFGAAKMFFIGGIYSRIADIFSIFYVTIFSPVLMATSSPFYGIGSTAKSTLFQKEFTNEQRATMGSLNSFAGSLFFTLISFFVGLLADKFNPREALLILQFF